MEANYIRDAKQIMRKVREREKQNVFDRDAAVRILARGMKRRVGDFDPGSIEFCEGCGRFADERDSEGVPLCGKCYQSLLDDSCREYGRRLGLNSK